MYWQRLFHGHQHLGVIAPGVDAAQERQHHGVVRPSAEGQGSIIAVLHATSSLATSFYTLT